MYGNLEQSLESISCCARRQSAICGAVENSRCGASSLMRISATVFKPLDLPGILAAAHRRASLSNIATRIAWTARWGTSRQRIGLPAGKPPSGRSVTENRRKPASRVTASAPAKPRSIWRLEKRRSPVKHPPSPRRIGQRRDATRAPRETRIPQTWAVATPRRPAACGIDPRAINPRGLGLGDRVPQRNAPKLNHQPRRTSSFVQTPKRRLQLNQNTVAIADETIRTGHCFLTLRYNS